MNEENTNFDEPNNEDWQAPPLPEEIEAEVKEEPKMSEVATLGNIFFEPAGTFEDIRRKPRFLLAFIIIAVLSTGFTIAFQQKIGDERMRRFITQQNEQNPQFENMPTEQKEQAVNFGIMIQKAFTYGLPLVLAIIFAIGALIYWVGVKAMGGSASYLHALSVWLYSTLPPSIIGSIANFIVLLFKSPDDIDIATSSRGLVSLNPSAFINGKEMPVVATLLSTFDIFVIWGIILAGIGLHKVGKISKGSAFAIVIILTLVSLTFRILQALVSGNPA